MCGFGDLKPKQRRNDFSGPPVHIVRGCSFSHAPHAPSPLVCPQSEGVIDARFNLLFGEGIKTRIKEKLQLKTSTEVMLHAIQWFREEAMK